MPSCCFLIMHLNRLSKLEQAAKEMREATGGDVL